MSEILLILVLQT